MSVLFFSRLVFLTKSISSRIATSAVMNKVTITQRNVLMSSPKVSAMAKPCIKQKTAGVSLTSFFNIYTLCSPISQGKLFWVTKTTMNRTQLTPNIKIKELIPPWGLTKTYTLRRGSHIGKETGTPEGEVPLQLDIFLLSPPRLSLVLAYRTPSFSLPIPFLFLISFSFFFSFSSFLASELTLWDPYALLMGNYPESIDQTILLMYPTFLSLHHVFYV